MWCWTAAVFWEGGGAGDNHRGAEEAIEAEYSCIRLDRLLLLKCVCLYVCVCVCAVFLSEPHDQDRIFLVPNMASQQSKF